MIIKRTVNLVYNFDGLAGNQVKVVKEGIEKWQHVIPLSYRRIYFETRTDVSNAQVEYSERYKVATISFNPDWHKREELDADILHEFLHLRIAPLVYFAQNHVKKGPLREVFTDRMEEVVESLGYLLREGL